MSLIIKLEELIRKVKHYPEPPGIFKEIEHEKWQACPAEMYDIILKDGSILMCVDLKSFKFTHMMTGCVYEFRDATHWRISQQ